MNREAMLKKFITDRPTDPFPRYGLAMEFTNRGDLEAAVRTFAELVEVAPTYVAAYLHYGGVLGRLGRKDEARRMYEQGIEQARAKGDGHAMGELEGALGTL